MGAFEDLRRLASLGPADALEIAWVGAGGPVLAVGAVVLTLVGKHEALQLRHRAGLGALVGVGADLQQNVGLGVACERLCGGDVYSAVHDEHLTGAFLLLDIDFYLSFETTYR